MSNAADTLGQIYYEAYRSEIGSCALPSWNELGEPVQQAIHAGTVAVVQATWKKQYKLMARQLAATGRRIDE